MEKSVEGKGTEGEITLDLRKNAKENAASLFEQAKKAKAKAASAREALLESEKELARALAQEQKETEAKKKEEKDKFRVKEKKQWYEQFHYFYTSGGKLVLAGKDSQQNDLLYSRYLEDDDLFFHADIQGAPAALLKKGKAGATEQEKLEAAQFAASFSSAWKTGAAGVDVYSVDKSQLSKHAQGGFVGKGGFAIGGKREWFRGIRLALRLCLRSGKAIVVPLCHEKNFERSIAIFPGESGKEEAAKKIAAILQVHVDEVIALLPSGKIRLSEAR